MPNESITEIYETRLKDIGDEGLKTHRYPIYIDNFNSSNVTPIIQECIHFTAVKQGGISLQRNAEQSRAIAKAEQDKFKKDNRTFDDRLTDGDSIPGDTPLKKKAEEEDSLQGLNASNIGERIASGASDALFGGFTGLIDVAKEQFGNVRSTAKNLEHCFIYMPGSVTFSEGANWGAEALGGAGNLIKEGIRGEGSVTDMLKNFAGGVASKVGMAAALGAANKAAGAIGALGVAGMADGIGAGLRAAGRFTENPYEEQLFNGIDFRTFQFDFAFAPASPQEGKEVEGIINMFRFHSKPNFIGGVLGEGQFTFPNEFAIEFMMNENGKFITNKFLPKLYNCVCTNVTTNFTPEGMYVALTDGRPQSYSLSLSFTETRKITQAEVSAYY